MAGKSTAALALKKELELERARIVDDPPVQGEFKKLSREKMEALILDHRDHGRRLAWSFLTTWRIRMKQDEVISVVGAALCEAANRFDENRGVAFKTFFFYHLRGMLLKEISRMIHEQRVLQFFPHSTMLEGNPGEQGVYSGPPVVPVEQNNPERLIEKKEIAKITWDACAQLDDLEQQVIIRHFVNDQSLIDIAEELNYCRCHISRVKSRGLAKLQRHLRKALQRSEDEGRDVVNADALETLRRSYTGGRGRRRMQAELSKVVALKKIA